MPIGCVLDLLVGRAEARLVLSDPSLRHSGRSHSAFVPKHFATKTSESSQMWAAILMIRGLVKLVEGIQRGEGVDTLPLSPDSGGPGRANLPWGVGSREL